MKIIQIDNWYRKEHYNFFSGMDYPFFNVSADVEVTEFYKKCKINGLSYFKSVLHTVSKVCNKIPEFRQRIRDNDNEIIEYDIVHPSFTLMTDYNNLFTYCTVDYNKNFKKFLKIIDNKIEINKKKKGLNLSDEKGRDDLLFITSFPWVSIKNIVHPFSLKNSKNSIPLITWGKHFENNNKLNMTFSVQVHHGLVDGYHVSLFFNGLQEEFNSTGSK